MYPMSEAQRAAGSPTPSTPQPPKSATEFRNWALARARELREQRVSEADDSIVRDLADRIWRDLERFAQAYLSPDMAVRVSRTREGLVASRCLNSWVPDVLKLLELASEAIPAEPQTPPPGSKVQPDPKAASRGRKSPPKRPGPVVPEKYESPVKLWPKFDQECRDRHQRPMVRKFVDWLKRHHAIDLDPDAFSRWWENYSRSLRRRRRAAGDGAGPARG
jgi:hypothetical protein